MNAPDGDVNAPDGDVNPPDGDVNPGDRDRPWEGPVATGPSGCVHIDALSHAGHDQSGMNTYHCCNHFMALR